MATLTPVTPAVQSRLTKILRAFGRTLPAADPTDYTPAFQPTPADDAYQAATSPLNALDDEDRALTSIFADPDFDGQYPDPQSWNEAEWAEIGAAWGRHHDRVDLDA